MRLHMAMGILLASIAAIFPASVCAQMPAGEFRSRAVEVDRNTPMTGSQNP
jgi:hypothetical protein